ncbi:MAG TPA: class I tRNA ligase family protein [Segeticoccus sp.]|uniref:leucine--tRNA ligase n=1 Tax=Segeticoccus sp. TaxID=2706531 RepID=UPI002D7EF269|nr:class I tRNA ligase family protein [Segeticoccus sp.]HET8602171.1 class I tRNA ligase family protein [Segeticoccus sp.]
MTETPHRYTADLAGQLELKWQDRWEEQGTFQAPNPAGPWADPAAVDGREKLFVMDMFPYPSGAGLHVGHPLGYIATDVFARFQRMTDKNVLHCLGYDAFGLPAEQYAVQTGQHPRKTTEDNMVVMKRQLRRLGLGHDSRRTIATIDPEFYRWTQWIFLQIYNSWYDEHAGRARPIGELVAELESGARPTPTGRPWADLGEDERRGIIDGERLAYTSEAPVNWCPGLGTVLANEEVTAEGRSERGNYPVFKRSLKQWMMRITKYADRLADDLDRLDWPEPVKLMQRNWIGRSHGANVRFTVPTNDETYDYVVTHGQEHPQAEIEVFTTRPDTLFGATFMVLAPEHPLVGRITPGSSGNTGDSRSDGWPEGTRRAWTGGAETPRAAVSAYRQQAARKSDLERQSEAREKTGVFTGAYATNPVNGQRIPVFIADYVLMGYGTGAIMAVPGGDVRDHEFATKFELPIVRTVQAPEDFPGDEAYIGDGAVINSSNDEVSLDGLDVEAAKETIIAWLEKKDLGRGTVTYKLRDWLFSRQRYWGEPFPIVYDEQGHAHALPDSMLPVELPDVPDYSPRVFDPNDAQSTPEPPLSRATDWLTVELDLGEGPQTYTRETNTMPNWAGSCWYELRYLDPANHAQLVDPENERYWMGPRPDAVAGAPGDRGDVAGAARTHGTDPGGVDLYVGGVEHAVLHLLYSRFWHKVLFDLGHVTSEEPFRKLFNQGYIQAFAFRDDRGQPVPAAEVEESADDAGEVHYTWQGRPVTREYGKMGKSLKNVVTPDEMFQSFGADTFRVYEMSMGPLELSRPWETRAVVGAQRFLQRLWRNVIDEETGQVTVVDEPADEQTRRVVHRTIADVRADYEGLRFNTAVAKLIELNNALVQLPHVPREAAEPLVLMTAPLAPHLAEELWARLGHEESLAHHAFPDADPALLVEDTVTCVLQVKGKVRDRIEVPADISDADLQERALASEKVQASLDGAPVHKVIVRAPKLVNVVPG